MKINLYDKHGRDDTRLQFEGGDVIIRTSDDAAGILLVHSHVLAERSPYFKSLFSGDWGKPEAMKDGRCVWRLRMFFDWDTSLALIQEETKHLSREFVRPNGCPPDLLARWYTITSEEALDDFRWRCGRRYRDYDIDRDMYSLPRQKFAYNDAQLPYAWTTDYYSDHDGSHGLEYTSVETYARYMRPDDHLWSGLRGTGGPPDYYHPLYSNYPAHFRGPFTHEEACKYWSNVWKTYLSFLYGHDVTFCRPHRKQRQVSFLLSVYRLAKYHQSTDSTAYRIGKALIQMKGIWKVCAVQPKWMACVGYEIGCHDIYFEAIRHIAGKLLLNSNLFTSISNIVDGYQDIDSLFNQHPLMVTLKLPAAIVKDIHECCLRMRESLINRHEMLLHVLSPLHMASEFSDPQCYHLATSALLAYFHAWYPIAPAHRWGPTTYQVEHKVCDGHVQSHLHMSNAESELSWADSRKLLPFLYVRLYRIAKKNDVQDTVRIFDLKALASTFAMAPARLASAILHILRSTKAADVLNGYMGPAPGRGGKCYGRPINNRRMDYSQCGRFVGPCDCDDSNHYTKHLSTGYSTCCGCFGPAPVLSDSIEGDRGSDHWRDADGSITPPFEMKAASRSELHLLGISSEKYLPASALTEEAISKRFERAARRLKPLVIETGHTYPI